MSDKIAVVLAADRHSRPEQEAIQGLLVAGLEHRPELDVTVVPHLYDLAPDGPAVRLLRSIRGDMIVLAWLYPRSAFWVLDASGVRGRLGRTFSLPEEDAPEPSRRKSGEAKAKTKIPDRTIWCFDLRAYDDPEPYLRQIDEIVAEKFGVAEPVAGRTNGEAKRLEEPTRARWYPVIDLERCTDCKECLNFCLFGVFSLDAAGGTIVEQPDACRPGCPACARICPSGAIMFPQHKDPAIAGDPNASLQGLKLDLSQIFAGVDPAALAAQERQRALGDTGPVASDTATKQPPPPAAKPDLDQLVDKVDGLDL